MRAVRPAEAEVPCQSQTFTRTREERTLGVYGPVIVPFVVLFAPIEVLLNWAVKSLVYPIHVGTKTRGIGNKIYITIDE